MEITESLAIGAHAFHRKSHTVCYGVRSRCPPTAKHRDPDARQAPSRAACGSGAAPQPETQSQLRLLDLPVPVGVAVTQKALPEPLQVDAADAGLRDRKDPSTGKTVAALGGPLPAAHRSGGPPLLRAPPPGSNAPPHPTRVAEGSSSLSKSLKARELGPHGRAYRARLHPPPWLSG